MFALFSGTALTVCAFLVGSMSAAQRAKPLRAELARARWDAEHDQLTGLANRTGLRRRFEQDRAAGRATTVVLLDLDGFKQVNDTWGHHAGDALLVEVADRLSAACDPAVLVGRLGGDEFLLLLPSADRGASIQAVRTMLTRLAGFMTISVGDAASVQLRATVSVGIAGPGEDDCWSSQLRRADSAMYRAKARRRGSERSSWALAEPGVGRPSQPPTPSARARSCAA